MVYATFTSIQSYMQCTIIVHVTGWYYLPENRVSGTECLVVLLHPFLLLCCSKVVLSLVVLALWSLAEDTLTVSLPKVTTLFRQLELTSEVDVSGGRWLVEVTVVPVFPLVVHMLPLMLAPGFLGVGLEYCFQGLVSLS